MNCFFQLRLEAVARLLPSSTLSAGTVIPFHVAVNTNNLEIYVGQIDLTVTDTPTVTTVVRTNRRDGYYRGDCHFFFILFFFLENNKYYIANSYYFSYRRQAL